jgi:parallel beta-helix repeat protein
MEWPGWSTTKILAPLCAASGIFAVVAGCGGRGKAASTTSGSGGAASSGSSSGSSSSGTSISGTGGGLAACAITSASGHVYYVDQKVASASDKNPGTQALPWETIQNAGNYVQAGDTVVVEPGNYQGVIFGWDAPKSGPYSTIAGTAASPIVIEADPAAAPGSVVIGTQNYYTDIAFDLEPGCDYVAVVGFTVTSDGSVTKAGIKVAGSTGNRILDNTVDGVSGIGGILVDNVKGALIQGNTVTNTQGSGDTGHGMYVSGSSTGVKVLHNSVHDNAYVGIHLNGDISEGGAGVVTGALIAGNLIYGNGQNGINADGLESSTIENNVIYGNARNGIELYQIDALGGSTGNLIVANSIDQSNAGYAINIAACQYDNQSSAPTPSGCLKSPFDTSTGNVAFDDVLLGGQGSAEVVTAADLSLSTNLTTAMPSPFVDADAGNYALAPGGPGLGAGIASFDDAGAPADGSGYDIGASSFGLVLVCP